MKLAIVLAAGESRRMGRAKTSLPLRGKTMLGRVVETLLAAPFDRLRVVVPPKGAHDLPDDPRVEIVENEQHREGMASSIRRGLADLPADTEMAAIALGDLPFVRVETLRRLVDTMTSEKAAIVYPTYEGRAGHPVLWHARLFEELGALRGDRGARKSWSGIVSWPLRCLWRTRAFASTSIHRLTILGRSLGALAGRFSRSCRTPISGGSLLLW